MCHLNNLFFLPGKYTLFNRQGWDHISSSGNGLPSWGGFDSYWQMWFVSSPTRMCNCLTLYFCFFPPEKWTSPLLMMQKLGCVTCTGLNEETIGLVDQYRELYIMCHYFNSACIVSLYNITYKISRQQLYAFYLGAISKTC